CVSDAGTTRRRWRWWILKRSPEPQESLRAHQPGSAIPAREHRNARGQPRVLWHPGTSAWLSSRADDGRDSAQLTALSQSGRSVSKRRSHRVSRIDAAESRRLSIVALSHL